MRKIFPIIAALVLVSATVFFASPALADDSISVEVRTIAASQDGDDFDDALQDIRNRLERGFRDYTSFEQIGRQTQQIALGSSQDFTLPTGDTLTLSYKGDGDKSVKLGLSLADRLDTTLRATPGSTFFQAGLSYRDATLVLAITVE